MTSVPNHRPLLSGSSFLAGVLLLLLVTTASCELFRPVDSTRPTTNRRPDRGEDDLEPVKGRRVFDEETGTYVYVSAPTEPMDTVEWTEDPNAPAPITEDGSYTYVAPATDIPTAPGLPPVRQTGIGRNGSRLLTGYGVDFVLPFLADRNLERTDNIDPNSLWALHFYSGAEMALDEVDEAGVAFDVRVQDSRATSGQIDRIVASPAFERSQLIIGPYLKAQVAQVAEAVRTQEKVLISPYSAAAGIAEGNTNYIQVNPTLETHLRTLLGHAFRTQGADRIVLVAPAGQRSRLAYFQDEYRLLTGDPDVEPLEEMIISGEVPDLGEYLKGRRTVFMVPVYEDQALIAGFLRQAYVATQADLGDNIAIYGLPQWAEFDQLNAEFIQATNVHISSSVYLDQLDPEVRRFRRAFYDRYAALPRDEAFVGYDVTRYFLRMAARYGTRFQFELENHPEELMHTNFAFKPVAVVPATAASVEEVTIDRFENKFVNILRYVDYGYQRVN